MRFELYEEPGDARGEVITGNKRRRVLRLELLLSDHSTIYDDDKLNKVTCQTHVLDL